MAALLFLLKLLVDLSLGFAASLGLELLIEGKFAIGISCSAQSTIGFLQLIVHISFVRAQMSRSFQMRGGALCLSTVKQNFTELVLRVGVFGMLSDYLLKELHRIVVRRLLPVHKTEIIHCIRIARCNCQLCSQFAACVCPVARMNVSNRDVVMSFGKRRVRRQNLLQSTSRAIVVADFNPKLGNVQQ